MLYTLAASAALVGLARAQGAGTETAETHPKMNWQECSGTGGNSCQNQNGEIVLDANWRWVHPVGTYDNCYEGNTWNATACPDNAACAQNCELEGVDYQATYGIQAGGNELTLKFVTEHEYGTNVGSRVYLMESESQYKLFNLNNNEFTFDVDVSELVCGLNGALYFVSMPQGGHGEAGAKYGTGYCDAQCPRDLKFIDGLGNVEGWEPSDSDGNAGVGQRGSCCAEMDIWEANSISTAVTPHSCDSEAFTECSGESCGGTYSGERYAGTCDPNGCDFNPYRVGVPDFYGPGKTVDTNQKMTVVTQFIADGGSLSEIRRFYVQNGQVIAQPDAAIEGLSGNVITQEFCDAQEGVFQEEEYPFNDHGGMASMSRAHDAGMVLVMSLWGDHYAHMEWLDSNYPPDGDASQPGVARGDCPNGISDPNDLISQYPNAQVKFSNIKFGPLGSTFAEPASARVKREKRTAERAAARARK